ncbi:MAG: PAS domain S-box protein [Candidatus Tenebribacter davisii]|nr:PAS domain S-box protein [Candidatus Tenebribacter davisii]
MKIRNRITYTFLSILFISLLVLSVISYVIVKDLVITSTLKNIESISDEQLYKLNNINEQNRERLKLVSSRTQLRKILKNYNLNHKKSSQVTMNKILNDALITIPDFEDLTVITLNGIVVASTNNAAIGKDYPDKSCFIKGQNDEITNHFFFDDQMALKFHLTGPLIIDNELLGVLVITVSEDKITNLTTDYSLFGETGYILLVIKTHEDNKYIISTRRDANESTNYIYASYDELGQISKKVIAKEKNTYSKIHDYRNKLMFAAVNYCEKLDIGFSVRIDREEILKPVVKHRNLSLIILFSSTLVMLLFIRTGSRLITKPIEKLILYTQKISQGDLDQKIETTSKDEIGLLSKSFNSMAENLRDDITKREQIESDLRESEKKYRIIFENTGTATIIVEENNIISLANTKFSELSGYSKEEIEGKKNWSEFILPTDLKKMQKQHKLRIENKSALNSYEFGLINRNNQVRNIILTIDMIPGTKKSVASLLDITEHNLTKKKIDHLNRVLRSISDINQLIIKVKDPKKLIEGACRNFVKNQSYYNAWIALLDESYHCTIFAEMGLGEKSIILKKMLRDGKLTECGKEVLETDIIIRKNPISECKDCPLSKEYKDRAAMVLRLEYGGVIYGIISVSVAREIVENDEEITLFKEVAADIAFAMYSINLEHQQKKAEEALKHSELRFRSFYDNSVMGLYRTNPAGDILDVNPTLLSMLSFTSLKDLQSRNLEQEGYVDDYGRELFKQRLKKDGKVIGLESAWTRKDGSVIYLRENAIAIKNKENKVLSYEGSVENITETKIAEKALRESEERFKKLSNLTFEGILIHDKGIIIDTNESLLEMFEFSREEVVGKNIIKLGLLPEYLKIVQENIIKNKVEPYEVMAKKKDGTIISIEIESRNVEYDEEETRVTAIRDITMRVKTENELKQKMNELEIFNDSAVDRELIINQLRTEINELLIKLDKNPRYDIIE